MKRILRNLSFAAMLFSLGLGLQEPAWAGLPVGAQAPNFQSHAAIGGKPFEFDLKRALANGPVVLYFFPAAFTQGCSLEARAFAEAIDQYAALGATVVGVSADKLDVLERFSAADCAGKFAVASDANHRVIQAYDAVSTRRADLAQRISYVISPTGYIIYEYADPNPEKHVANTLEALKTWREVVKK